MKKRNSAVKWVAVASAGLLGGASAYADAFYVENTEIVGNVPSQQRETIQEWISSSIAGQSEHSVVSAQERADFVLQPKIIQQGDRYTVVVEKIEDGRIVWAGRTEPVVTENLSQNVNRLVERMITGRGDQPVEITVIQAAPERSTAPAAGTTRKTVAVEDETREVPLGRFFLGFGPHFLPNSIDQSSDPQLGFHTAYNWDLDNALLNLFGDFVFNGSDVGLAGGGLGVNYLPLRARETTPFVGAELGYAAAFPEDLDDTIGGFTVTGLIGGQFFRRSMVNLEAAFFAGVFTSQIRGETPFISGIRVGIYFG